MVQLDSQHEAPKDHNATCNGEKNLIEQEEKFSQLSLSEATDFDTELIQELRSLMREEHERSQADGSDIYCRKHYETIMASDATCWRYLVHYNKRLKDTFASMKQALIWRKKEKIEELLDAKRMAKDFWHRAPIGFVGKCRDGHELVYAVGKDFKRTPTAEMRKVVTDFVSHLLFNWDAQRVDTMDKMVVVFDIENTTISNVDLEFVRYLISIIDYVPARFHAIHINGIPFLIRPVIRLIISWLPDRFRRISYCGTKEQLIAEVVDEDNLPYEVRGTAPDTWRLAPIEAPWVEESDYDMDIIKGLYACISFNLTQERLSALKKMQLDYEASIASNGKIKN